MLNSVTQKLLHDVMLEILYNFCRDTRVKGLTVTLPEDENIPNAVSDYLVQSFIYLINHPTGDTYRGQISLVKLVIYRRAN